MDPYTYTPAELSELTLLAQGLIDTQFQYWITITFAVVVAGFAVGRRLSRMLRFVVAGLYVLTTAILVIRTVTTGRATSLIVGTLEDSEALLFAFPVSVPVLRMIVYFLGTLAAIYFLVAPTTFVDSDSGASS
jgi:hypothetical protein